MEQGAGLQDVAKIIFDIPKFNNELGKVKKSDHYLHYFFIEKWKFEKSTG